MVARQAAELTWKEGLAALAAFRFARQEPAQEQQLWPRLMRAAPQAAAESESAFPAQKRVKVEGPVEWAEELREASALVLAPAEAEFESGEQEWEKARAA